MINFMQGCPYEMLEEVYCGAVISSVLKAHCSASIDHAKSLLNCVQKHNLSALLIKHVDDNMGTIANAMSPLQGSWLVVAVLKIDIDDALMT